MNSKKEHRTPNWLKHLNDAEATEILLAIEGVDEHLAAALVEAEILTVDALAELAIVERVRNYKMLVMITLQLLLWQPEKMKGGLTDNFLWYRKELI